MIPSSILGLVMNRWVQLALAVGLTFVVAYSYGRYTGWANEHEKRLLERAECQAALGAARAKTERLQHAFDDSLEMAGRELQRVAKDLLDTEDRLKTKVKENEKLLRSIALPNVFVELYNESTGVSRPTASQQEAGPPVNENTGSSSTLAELAEVVVENNTNHNLCIAQVKGLQTLICSLYAADGQPLEYPVCQDGT